VVLITCNSVNVSHEFHVRVQAQPWLLVLGEKMYYVPFALLWVPIEGFWSLLCHPTSQLLIFWWSTWAHHYYLLEGECTHVSHACSCDGDNCISCMVTTAFPDLKKASQVAQSNVRSHFKRCRNNV